MIVTGSWHRYPNDRELVRSKAPIRWGLPRLALWASAIVGACVGAVVGWGRR